MDKQTRFITLQLFSSVINGTPVGNRDVWVVNIKRKERNLPPVPKGYVGGRLRNNWNTSVGAPDLSANNPPDASGSASIDGVIAHMGGAGKVTYMANALPYAEVIEYEGHSPTQAPAGMVRINVARFGEIVADSGSVVE